MAQRAIRDHVELFHLLFLRVLMSGTDKAQYVVKGGCNLRFWFNSVRYSEDLDLDVTTTARNTLKNKVDKLLAGVPLTTMLRAQRLRIASVTAPRKNETTQRWKLALAAEGISSTISTKIEFTRRGKVAPHAFEPVAATIAQRYRITPTLGHHYLAPAAIAQKIGALAHRSQTQARDIFDLQLLLPMVDPATLRLDKETRGDLPRAIERAMDVSFDDFQGQVGAFLESEHAALYASRATWNELQLQVVSALEALAE